MKLKQIPEDFQVEELAEVVVGERGIYAFYQLEKCGLGTPEAVDAVCRRLHLDPRRAGWGGLKDRHAVTRQYLTIFKGPKRGVEQTHLKLTYLGQLAQPFTPALVAGNRFDLTLRNLPGHAVDRMRHALEEARLDGVANYYDDQRFGSVGPSRRFIARHLIDEDYESALKLALVDPYENDSAADKDQKRLLRDHWGDWSRAKAKLPRGPVRDVIAFLADYPGDFRGAIVRMRKDLLSIYLAAYQSALWNRMLANWIESQTRPEQRAALQLELGPAPSPLKLDEKQRDRFQRQALPLPSSRLKIAEDDPLKPIIDDVMAEENLELSRMKLKHFREPYFSKGDRAVCFVPKDLNYQAESDDLHEGRMKLLLHFELPRGCYATMLVKRFSAAD